MEKRSADFLANWNNWDKELDELAKIHRKQSYFKVSGQYDTFDNIRATIWQNKADKAGVITGAIWRPQWSYQSIISKEKYQGGWIFVIKSAPPLVNGIMWSSVSFIKGSCCLQQRHI